MREELRRKLKHFRSRTRDLRPPHDTEPVSTPFSFAETTSSIKVQSYGRQTEETETSTKASAVRGRGEKDPRNFHSRRNSHEKARNSRSKTSLNLMIDDLLHCIADNCLTELTFPSTKQDFSSQKQTLDIPEDTYSRVEILREMFEEAVLVSRPSEPRGCVTVSVSAIRALLAIAQRSLVDRERKEAIALQLNSAHRSVDELISALEDSNGVVESLEVQLETVFRKLEATTSEKSLIRDIAGENFVPTLASVDNRTIHVQCEAVGCQATIGPLTPVYCQTEDNIHVEEKGVQSEADRAIAVEISCQTDRSYMVDMEVECRLIDERNSVNSDPTDGMVQADEMRHELEELRDDIHRLKLLRNQARMKKMDAEDQTHSIAEVKTEILNPALVVSSLADLKLLNSLMDAASDALGTKLEIRWSLNNEQPQTLTWPGLKAKTAEVRSRLMEMLAASIVKPHSAPCSPLPPPPPPHELAALCSKGAVDEMKNNSIPEAPQPDLAPCRHLSEDCSSEAKRSADGSVPEAIMTSSTQEQKKRLRLASISSQRKPPPARRLSVLLKEDEMKEAMLRNRSLSLVSEFSEIAEEDDNEEDDNVETDNSAEEDVTDKHDSSESGDSEADFSDEDSEAEEKIVKPLGSQSSPLMPMDERTHTDEKSDITETTSNSLQQKEDKLMDDRLEADQAPGIRADDARRASEQRLQLSEPILRRRTISDAIHTSHKAQGQQSRREDRLSSAAALKTKGQFYKARKLLQRQLADSFMRRSSKLEAVSSAENSIANPEPIIAKGVEVSSAGDLAHLELNVPKQDFRRRRSVSFAIASDGSPRASVTHPVEEVDDDTIEIVGERISALKTIFEPGK